MHLHWIIDGCPGICKISPLAVSVAGHALDVPTGLGKILWILSPLNGLIYTYNISSVIFASHYKTFQKCTCMITLLTLKNIFEMLEYFQKLNLQKIPAMWHIATLCVCVCDFRESLRRFWGLYYRRKDYSQNNSHFTLIMKRRKSNARCAKNCSVGV